VRQGAAGYSNVEILPGDRLVAINGLPCGRAGIHRIQQLLRGARDSAVQLTLARGKGGAFYSVHLRRHGRCEFQGSDTPAAEVLYGSQRGLQRHSAPAPLDVLASQQLASVSKLSLPTPQSLQLRLDSESADVTTNSTYSPTLARGLALPDHRGLSTGKRAAQDSSADPELRRIQRQQSEEEGDHASSRYSSGPASEQPSARPFDMPPVLERWLGLSLGTCSRPRVPVLFILYRVRCGSRKEK